MQIIPKSRMSFQTWFKGKRHLTKYTQQHNITKKGPLQISQWPNKLELLHYVLVRKNYLQSNSTAESAFLFS